MRTAEAGRTRAGPVMHDSAPLPSRPIPGAGCSGGAPSDVCLERPGSGNLRLLFRPFSVIVRSRCNCGHGIGCFRYADVRPGWARAAHRGGLQLLLHRPMCMPEMHDVARPLRQRFAASTHHHVPCPSSTSRRLWTLCHWTGAACWPAHRRAEARAPPASCLAGTLCVIRTA